MNSRMFNKYQLEELQELQNEGFVRGAIDAAKGAVRVAGPAAKTAARGTVAAAKAAKTGYSKLPTVGKVAVAGAGAALAAKGARRGLKTIRKADTKRKSLSSALYGGGGDENPLSGRNVRDRAFGEERNIEEGILKTAMKGAALAGGAYLGYKGLQKLGGGSARAGRGRGAALAGGAGAAKKLGSWCKQKK